MTSRPTWVTRSTKTPGASGRELTRGGGLLATALDTLRALGRAVVTVDDRWYPAGAVMGG
jgi:hypothetical protein